MTEQGVMHVPDPGSSPLCGCFVVFVFIQESKAPL